MAVPRCKDAEACFKGTVEAILEKAKEKASIRKDVTFRSLCNTFATHPPKGGVDPRCIQEPLGYDHSITTEIYTHMSDKDLSGIKSPLDLVPEGER